MIPFWKVQAIEALLAEDALSQRAIAKRLHVGRGVVTSIANGRRPDYHALRGTPRPWRRRRRQPGSAAPNAAPWCNCLALAAAPAGRWSTAAAFCAATCRPPPKGCRSD